ncbi:hypothetical protein D6821_00490 [Candidatus Parcubacteria bacterium]|nr:MAG: hypothetical protein D6821_00490 [Candidatus Parcubacteria bacterium]
MTAKQKENLPFTSPAFEQRKRFRLPAINFRALNFVLLLILIGGGIYYIIGINELSVRGFIVNQLNQEVKALEEKHNQLEERVTELKSYVKLEERIKATQMVKVDKIEYLDSEAGAVAYK